ncbi:MAG: 6-phosphogluconolactonase [Acidobacteriota bacterium]
MNLVQRYPDAKSAAESCGARILALLNAAIVERGIASVAISGGASPRIMFEFFARSPFEWNKVHVFWVDERCVPRTDPQSNFKLANDAWLRPARVPADNIHRVHTELGHAIAASRYAEEIRPFLPLDVIHRGMGADGHTASLFPGDPSIHDRTGLTAVAHQSTPRITLLPAVLESATNTVILATGADKAEPLHAVLQGRYNPLKYPAQIASRDPAKATWFIDEAAAAKL